MATKHVQQVQAARKVTLNLPQAVFEKVGWLAERLNLTQTQVIREAIELRAGIQQEIDDGGTVLIERRSGDLVRLWITGS
jgi:predicted transcriptional regulator